MENIIKAAILFLAILVVSNWIAGRNRRNDPTKKAASGDEPEVPPISIHGYMAPDSFASQNDVCTPTAQHGGGSDLGCGGASGHHH
jgi:hypothetical protein